MEEVGLEKWEVLRKRDDSEGEVSLLFVSASEFELSCEECPV